MAKLNQNPLEIHTAVKRSQRDYLMRLAATPGLTKTGTLAELLSYAAATFLTTKPYVKNSWQWIQPEGYYQYVANERRPNADWIALNPSIVDITVDEKIISAKRIVSSLRAVADALPKQRINGTGMSILVHTFINWTLTELYPPSIYAPPMAPPKIVIKASEMPIGRNWADEHHQPAPSQTPTTQPKKMRVPR